MLSELLWGLPESKNLAEASKNQPCDCGEEQNVSADRDS